MGLETLHDIPERVPILRWNWVEESWRQRVLMPVHEYPAFKSRITYPPDYIPPLVKENLEEKVPPYPVNAQPSSSKRYQADPEDSNDSGDENMS